MQKILLIDAGQDSAALLEQAMVSRLASVTIERCSETTAGIAAAVFGDFDLVVVNQTCDATALGLLRTIRKTCQALPVLVLTRETRSRQIFLEAGASEYLTFDDGARLGPVVAELLTTAET